MKTVFGDGVTKEDFEYLLQLVKRETFKKREWVKRDALLRGDGALVEFIGQAYDSNVLTFIGKGWEEDRCELCECDLTLGCVGMTSDGRNWFCISCYETLRGVS